MTINLAEKKPGDRLYCIGDATLLTNDWSNFSSRLHEPLKQRNPSIIRLRESLVKLGMQKKCKVNLRNLKCSLKKLRNISWYKFWPYCPGLGHHTWPHFTTHINHINGKQVLVLCLRFVMRSPRSTTWWYKQLFPLKLNKNVLAVGCWLLAVDLAVWSCATFWSSLFFDVGLMCQPLYLYYI